MLSNTIAVLVVDDHPVVRDGIALQLGRHSDIDVVGLAATGHDAITDCSRLRPDVAVLDVRLPDRTAPEILPEITRGSPHTKVLLFTAFPEHVSVAPTLAAGAAGLLVKDASVATLAAAIREVARTGHYRAGPNPPDDTSTLVSAREYDIIRLVATGLTNSEIGEQLHLSPNTVKAYLRTVMRKLDARNRAQVISRARAHGLL